MKIAVTLFIVFALFLPNTFAQDYTLWDAATGAHIRTITLRHTIMIWSVSFSPDGGTIASGSHDATIRLWDAATGAHIRTITTGHTRLAQNARIIQSRWRDYRKWELGRYYPSLGRGNGRPYTNNHHRASG